MSPNTRLDNLYIFLTKNIYKNKHFFIKFGGSLLFLILISTFFYQKNSNKLTSEDIRFITEYLSPIKQVKPKLNSNYAASLTFKEQTVLILQIQHIILKNSSIRESNMISPKNYPKGFIPKGSSSLHYSFIFEKAFESLGFPTRHVTLYENKRGGVFLKKLFTNNLKNIEISEVLTKKGWLIVDSKNNWIGLTKNYCPISMERLKKENFDVDWLYPALLEGTPNFSQKSYFFIKYYPF